MSSQQLSANQKKEVKRTRTEAKREAASAGYAATHPVLFLQQRIGNREVNRLLRARVIQAKLRLSQPPDIYEREADQAAEAVMRRMEVPRVSPASNGAVIQRQPAGEPNGTAPAESAGPALIVDDEAEELQPGQMRKSQFLAELQPRVYQATREAVAGAGQVVEDSTDLEEMLGLDSRQDSRDIERSIHNFAPETTRAASASEYISMITERVLRSVGAWARTGEAPGSQPAGAPGAGSQETGEGTPAQPGTVQFKTRPGGQKGKESIHGIIAQLGPGRPLDHPVQSRMESAFGMSFSGVRVHTDARSAAISSHLNARAFTLGKHIAFGPGEYQPGSLVGDALIAHELAHVAQQRAVEAAPTGRPQGSSQDNHLEEDADTSAVGAMLSLWSGTKAALSGMAQNALPRMRSGLRLQRCSIIGGTTPPNQFKFKTVVNPTGGGPGGWKVACVIITFGKMVNGAPVTVQCPIEVGVPAINFMGPVSDAIAQVEASAASDAAGQIVIRKYYRQLPAAQGIICMEYRKEMQIILQTAIPGARVTNFTRYCP